MAFARKSIDSDKFKGPDRYNCHPTFLLDIVDKNRLIAQISTQNENHSVFHFPLSGDFFLLGALTVPPSSNCLSSCQRRHWHLPKKNPRRDLTLSRTTGITGVRLDELFNCVGKNVHQQFANQPRDVLCSTSNMR